MPKKNTDPLRGLDASLDAEHSAFAKRFRDAERFTQGLPAAASIRQRHSTTAVAGGHVALDRPRCVFIPGR